MKFGTTKDRLLRGVQLAERIVGKKETLPVLSCILIEASGHDVVLRATNLEAGIEVSCPAEVNEQGVVAVPAAILSQTLRAVSGDKVMLRAEDGNLVIESRGSKNVLKAVPHDEFPALPAHQEGAALALPREKLMEGLQSVVYAASPSMIRPELGSVFVSVSDEGLVCAATDSFRLAEKKIPGTRSSETKEILIPLKHATELSHVLEHLSAPTVEVYTDDSQLIATGDGTRFISRVIDGSFPNYKEIIPKAFTTEATVLKADFSELLRKARVFAGAEQNIAFHAYPARKVFTATARSAEVGEMSDTVEAALSGEDIDINFHIGYLADFLASVRADSIVLGFSGQARPLVIRGVGDAGFTYLVMPLNR